jgi:hypothetical protein
MTTPNHCTYRKPSLQSPPPESLASRRACQSIVPFQVELFPCSISLDAAPNSSHRLRAGDDALEDSTQHRKLVQVTESEVQASCSSTRLTLHQEKHEPVAHKAPHASRRQGQTSSLRISPHRAWASRTLAWPLHHRSHFHMEPSATLAFFCSHFRPFTPSQYSSAV